jgi:hypothetical protein
VKREEEAKMRFTMRGFFFFYSFLLFERKGEGIGIGGSVSGFSDDAGS